MKIKTTIQDLIDEKNEENEILTFLNKAYTKKKPYCEYADMYHHYLCRNR